MKNLKNKWITKNPETRLYKIPVPIIGLTGGIGTGKSTVANLFREKNIPVIDADLLVKNIYARPESLEFISKNFPHAIQNGEIHFQTLRKTAFVDPVAKKQIEDFIYFHLPDEFLKEFSALINPKLIVYDVPLLFEKNLDDKVDLSVCVYAPESEQIKRILLRDKSSNEVVKNIILSQMNIENKKKLANFVIVNQHDLETLKIAFDNFLDEITT